MFAASGRCLFLMSALVNCGSSLNVDTQNVLRFTNNVAGTQFGFTSLLHNNGKEFWVLFGAPRDQWSGSTTILKPGAVYKCSVTSGSRCEQVPIGIERNYHADYRQSNMSLGMTLFSEPISGFVTTCAPRLIYQPAGSKDFFLNGACFTLSRDLTPMTEMHPMDRYGSEGIRPQTEYKPKIQYQYGMGEFGFSGCTSQGKSIFGAPGYQNWEGAALLYYSALDDDGELSDPAHHGENYLGYSVGLIDISNHTYIVAGAPRMQDVAGQVYIFESGDTMGWKTLRGSHLGEYFGASVLVADINKDGHEDLLVGAPMYSPTLKLKKGVYESGAVKVFLNTGSDLISSPNVLLPDVDSSAGRFGLSMSLLGDLNADGYNDVAIGAPYEDSGRGSVYVFHGGKDGLSNTRRERIVPKSKTTRGFGYSISPGVDVSNNKYPDFAVGAVDSDEGFLYRSNPVVNINASLTLNIPSVPVDGGNCSIPSMGNNFFCTTLMACLSYNQPVHSVKAINLTITVEVDPDLVNPRGYVADPGEVVNPSKGHYDAVMQLTSENKQQCKPLTAYIHPVNPQGDRLKPIQFKLVYNLIQKSKSEFCSSCPVLAQATHNYALTTTSYKVNCKHDGCLVHLRLKANIVGQQPGSEISVGRKDPLELSIIVESDESSDIAYKTFLLIELSDGLEFNNPDKCTRVDGRDDAVKCNIDDAMAAGSIRDYSLKIMLTDTQRKDISVNITLKTDSNDTNALVNKKHFQFPLVHRADVEVRGRQRVYGLLFNHTSYVSVEHNYTVEKYYDSRVEKVVFSLHIPTWFNNDRNKRYPIVDLQTLSSVPGVSSECDTMTLGGLKRRKRASPNSASLTLQRSVRQIVLDCSTAICVRIRCILGPFDDAHSKFSYHTRLVLNVSQIMQYTGTTPEQIRFITEANITIQDRKRYSTESKPKAKTYQIITVLEKEGRPMSLGISWWWYLIAVLVGLVVVAFIFFLLYKCGFFKRETMEELEEMQKESLLLPTQAATHSPINNMVDVDNNDNSYHEAKV